MKIFMRFMRFCILALLILAFASACGPSLIPQTGEMRTENHTVDQGSATTAHIQIVMDMGELTINSGTTGSVGGGKLMEGTFVFNLTHWQPEVNYSIDGSLGTLLVNQPDSNNSFINKEGQNHWDLRLSEDVPIDLEISTGAGNSELNLSGIDLTHLMIATGAGNGTFDLSGVRNRDLSVSVMGGVGNITILLPSEMGVQATIQSGIGDVESSGFSRDGDLYTNDAFGETSETLFLDIESGIGSVDLQLR